MKEAEKAKAEADKLAYIDPAKAEQAREEGNAFFKVSPLPSSTFRKGKTDQGYRLVILPRRSNHTPRLSSDNLQTLDHSTTVPVPSEYPTLLNKT